MNDLQALISHTPGPWVVSPTTLHPAVRSVGTADVGPRRICTVGSMNHKPIDQHNARLIAAAPDLLEALWNLNEQLAADGMQSGSTYGPLCHAAVVAIAKAVGEPA